MRCRKNMAVEANKARQYQKKEYPKKLIELHVYHLNRLFLLATINSGITANYIIYNIISQIYFSKNNRSIHRKFLLKIHNLNIKISGFQMFFIVHSFKSQLF